MTDLSGARFVVRPYLLRSEQMVEVTLGSRLIAGIYPTDEGLRILSEHITSAQFVEGSSAINPGETVVTMEVQNRG